MTTERSSSNIVLPGIMPRESRRGHERGPHFRVESSSELTRPAEHNGSRLLLNCYFLRGLALEGVGTFVSGLTDGMAEAGWRVRLLSPGGHSVGGHCEERKYQPGPLGLWRYIAGVRESSQDADVVCGVENNPTLGWLARFSRCTDRTFSYFYTPLQSFRTLGEMGLTRQSFLHTLAKHTWFGRQQNWSQRRCIVASQFQAQQLYELGATEVHVLPGGGLSRRVAMPTRAEARRELGWDDRPVVGYLGHFSPAKGVPVLIDAFSRCRTSAVLALAHSGRGRLPRASQAQLTTLRQEGRVRELGVVDPRKFLAACDLSVLPFVTSSIHHLPLVLLESFAAATPVVVSRVGGVFEQVQAGVNGDLVTPRDPAALAAAIQRHLADLDVCHAMGRQARKLFETELANEVFCARLSDLIRRERT